MDFFDRYSAAFLGLQLQRLLTEINEGGSAALQDYPSKLPARLSSAVIYLKHCGPCSIAELADALSVSHQLVSARVKQLRELGLIKENVDPSDRRRSLVALTVAGACAAEEVDAVCLAGVEAYRVLFEELGVDLFSVVTKARHALKRRSLDARINDVISLQRTAAPQSMSGDLPHNGGGA